MTVASAASGSIAASSAEQQFNAALTSAGIYQLALDSSAMAMGDEYVIRIYSKSRSGDTERVEASFRLFGVQNEVLKRFPPVATDCHFRATIQKSAGSDRSFPWSINTL